MLFTVVSLLMLGTGCSDPEFENCYIEIIDTKNDTIKFENVYVEFEGHLDNFPGKPSGDNILIKKNGIEINYPEDDIKKMTIIYEPNKKTP